MKTLNFRHLRRALGLGLVAVGLGLVGPAEAVGTRRFEFESQDDFLGGDLRGVAVDSQGNLRAGWNLGTQTITGASTVLSSLTLNDGSVLLGTGNAGKVLKVSGGQISDYADTKQIAVTALVAGAGNTVYAATVGGKIFKIDGPGAMTELPAIADVENVFALAYDAKKNGLYVATGPNGKLFFVPSAGAAQLVFDSDEPNLVSVAVAPDGTVYAGSSGKGLLFKITGPGKATVLASPPGDEIKAIAFGKNGSLFVIANEMGENEGGGGGGSRRPGMGVGPSRGGGGGRAGRGGLFRIEADGSSEELLARRDTHFVSLALDDSGRPYVGTGVEGRVYTVDDNHTSMLVADIDGRQVGALSVGGKKKFIVGSDPAVFHEIRGTGGADASWTSKVLDAGLRANFGRLSWHADGAVELQVRTGNNNVPDATWSDWSQAIAAPGKVNTPPGRFVQVRARFSKGGEAILHDISLPFVTDNARAVVTSVEAQKRRSERSSGGGVQSSGADIPSRTTTVKVSWRVDNPDSDQLRYRVQFRFEGQPNAWRDLTKVDDVLSRTEIDWETASLPEGTYRVRVEATDEPSNPPDKVTRHSLESGPILVDNTAPVFRSLKAAGKRVQGEVVDGLGPIARIDFAVDGRTDWRPLAPKDGIFDEAAEEIDIDLASIVGQGPHLIAIRAFDQAGNQVTRDIEIK